MSLLPTARPARTLTRRQHEVLEAIEHFCDRHGYAPTLRELADALGLASPSTVLRHVRILEDHGKVVRRARRPRTTLPSTSQPVQGRPGTTLIPSEDGHDLAHR